jgi:carbon-monoxide dehydrogenase small subunit
MSDSDFDDKTFVDISAIINGKPVNTRVKSRQHLADFLRHELELTGTHLGCEHGACGACTVIVNGSAVRGCLMLAAQADGKSIDTIEGLSASGKIADLQKAFIESNAAQCAFCASGMLLTAYELVSQDHSCTRDDIREYISGNLCRCTGYQAIVDAISSVIERRSAERRA